MGKPRTAKIDAIIQGIYDKDFDDKEIRDIAELVKRWCVDNFDDRKNEVDAIKAEFYEACRTCYPTFYFENFASSDNTKYSSDDLLQ